MLELVHSKNAFASPLTLKGIHPSTQLQTHMLQTSALCDVYALLMITSLFSSEVSSEKN